MHASIVTISFHQPRPSRDTSKLIWSAKSVRRNLIPSQKRTVTWKVTPHATSATMTSKATSNVTWKTSMVKPMETNLQGLNWLRSTSTGWFFDWFALLHSYFFLLHCTRILSCFIALVFQLASLHSYFILLYCTLASLHLYYLLSFYNLLCTECLILSILSFWHKHNITQPPNYGLESRLWTNESPCNLSCVPTASFPILEVQIRIGLRTEGVDQIKESLSQRRMPPHLATGQTYLKVPPNNNNALLRTLI